MPNFTELIPRYHRNALPTALSDMGYTFDCGRMAKPEDLTGMAVFLATENADYIVAQNLWTRWW
jgi:hypothetical protein